ncbi:MAG: response regulator [Candidatus Binatia bacterium]
MPCIRVALVEDDLQFLDKMMALLTSEPSLKVVGCYTTGEAAVAEISMRRPEIALIDLGLPGMSGVEVIRRITKQGENTECVVLTSFDDDIHLFAALQAGAIGYLVKTEISLSEIARLLQDMRSGGAPMSPGIARRVLQTFREQPRPKRRSPEVQELSRREQEILEYRVKGFPTKKVAEALHISYETVRLHQKHIYKKLHVHSMGEAVAVWRGEKTY